MNPRWSVTGYLNNSSIRRKVLVVGCGTTPENVTMGTEQTAMQGTTCSLGRRHSRDFTIDISADAGADLTANLLQIQHSLETDIANLGRLAMLHSHGFKKFDAVIFEYLSKGLPGPTRDNVFSFDEIRTGIISAHKLLKDGGEIIFYNGNSTYRAMAVAAMNTLGCKGIVDTVANGHLCCRGTTKHV